MIGERDRYDPERFNQMRADRADSTIWEPNSKPMPPAIGSSSAPFKGDVEHLLEFCDTADQHWSDESWNGLHLAENAKSNGEAEVLHTNGRIRLVVATETTRDDCVAILMHPHSFRAIYRHMRDYRERDLAFRKIAHEINEAFWTSHNLRSEINDCEKELPELEASGSATVGIWRRQERLSELRTRYEDAERRESALKESQKEVTELMNSLENYVTTEMERVFEEANLLPHLETPPQSYTDSQPSPSVERPISYMHGEVPLRSTADSTSKIYDGDIDDSTQFPSLSTAQLRGPSETSRVDAEILQNDKEQKRGNTASSDHQDNNPSLDAAKGEGAEEGQEEEDDNENFIHSESEDKHPDSWRKEEKFSRDYRQSHRMYNLAVSRREDPHGHREEVYRQQHDRSVRLGKVPETREVFDTRWERDHDRFVRNTKERLGEDIAMAAEAGVRLP